MEKIQPRQGVQRGSVPNNRPESVSVSTALRPGDGFFIFFGNVRVQSPAVISVLPSMTDPVEPQCRVASPMRAAGKPSIRIEALPPTTCQVFEPQQEACTPLSPLRRAGLWLMVTVVEPVTAGPMTVWGQAGQPWLSCRALALSPSRAIPGMAFLPLRDGRVVVGKP